MIPLILTDAQRTFGAFVSVVSICVLFVYYAAPPSVRAVNRWADRKIAEACAPEEDR